MYTKTKEINQYFSFSGNIINFHENGCYQFNNSSFIAFKKFNQYIDKTAQYCLSYLGKVLKFYNQTEEYCFQITEREFIEAKSEKNIFIDSIFKKYSKYLSHNHTGELFLFQENNRLFFLNRSIVLELHENFTENFQTSNCQEKHINVTNNCVFNDFNHYFNFPKSLTFDKNISINLEDEIIFNSFNETIKIKTGETLKNTLNFNHGQKIFKLFLGEKIQLFQRLITDKFYFKIEKKNFTVYGLINNF